MHGTFLYKWHSPNYIKHEKGSRWFLLAGVIVLGFIVVGLMLGDITMSLAFICLAGVYYLKHRNEPENLDCALTTLGLQKGKQFFPYAKIEYFYLVVDKSVEVLYFKVHGVSSEQMIYLHHAEASDVRDLLLGREVLEAREKKEPLIHAIIRLLKI